MLVCSICNSPLYAGGLCPNCSRKEDLKRYLDLREPSLTLSSDLLDSIQFRNIITFLKNGGMRMSAIWLVHKLSLMSIKDCKEYVSNCHVHHSQDGITIEE